MSATEKPLRAEERAYIRSYHMRLLAEYPDSSLSANIIRLCDEYDAERAKVGALKRDKADMLQSSNNYCAEIEARATAAEAKAGKVRDLIDFWFSPWGAYKGERWEEISGDRPFSPDVMLDIIRAALAKEKPDAGK